MNKRIIWTLIIVGAVIGVAVVSSVSLQKQAEIIPQESRTLQVEDRTPEQEDRTLISTILEARGLSYDVSVPEGSTAYDLMVAASQRYNDFSFKGKEFSGLGFFVEEINGFSQDQKEGIYWIYYINGQAAPVGVSQYKVKENDVITWKYEKEH